MNVNDAKSNLSIGFLTVLDDPQCGLVGGYLVLNRLGRPLEFHCTAPIRPSRAQQILYGPTLEPYLFGEQIGRTLVASAKAEPLAVFTDRLPVLALRELVEVPVILVLGAATAAEGDAATCAGSGWDGSPEPSACGPETRPTAYRVDSAHAASIPVAAFRLGRNRVAVASWAADDRQVAAARLGELAETFDCQEPFERIREAIEEARRGG